MTDENSTRDKRERQLDAIIAAYYRAVETGECVDQCDFIAQYPELQKELSEFFADIGMLNAARPHVQQDLRLAPTVTDNTPEQQRMHAGAVMRYFGAYEIIEELGSGGMGVVYKARHTRLRKLVALKMIRAGALATGLEVKMFQAEARAAAKLDHPGIVAVHEVGLHADQYFYSMDFVAGDNLSKLHREEPVPARRAAELVRQMAEAIHYAHSQGIVHRDLKPANVLLTTAGSPRITDFGLAKRMWADDESIAGNLTQTGQILGTAGYMSPEQAEGKTKLVGPAADVYALGAVLYALLTSRAPFVGESQADTIKQVINKEPVAPRILNPSLPRDLETICLKCLNKERHERYGTAQVLADDLAAFLEGRPIIARPIGSIERAAKWVRRHRLISSLLLLTFVSIFAGTTFSIYFAIASQRQTLQTLEAKGKAEAAKQETDALLTRTNELFEDSQRQLYRVNLNASVREWESGSPTIAKARLAECPQKFRHWEYHALARLFESDSMVLGQGAPPLAIAVSPNGRWVATGHGRGAQRNDRPKTLIIRDTQNGSILHSIDAEVGNVDSVAFSPDNTTIALGGQGPIKLFAVETGQPLGLLAGHKKHVMSLKFSVDGAVLISGSVDGCVKVWDVHLQQEIKTIQPERGGVWAVGISPNGKVIASGGTKFQLWDRESGECLHTTENLGAFALEFLSDLELVTGCVDGTVRLWDLNSRVCRQVFYGHKDAVTSLAVTEQPQKIISASSDGTLRLWNPETCLPEKVLYRQDKMISRVATVPGSNSIVMGSSDGRIVRREIDQSSQPLVFKPVTRKISKSVFSSDGRRIIFGTIDGKVVTYSVESGALTATINVGDAGVTCVQLSSSETLLAVACKDKTLQMLDASSGRPIRSLVGLDMASDCLAISPAASVIAAGDYKHIRMWNYDTGQLIGQWEAHGFTVGQLRFSRDGRKLYSASISGGHGVKIWDVETQTELVSPGGRRQTSGILELTKDGCVLFTSGPSLWDAEDGSLIRNFPDGSAGGTISPDGERIAGIDSSNIKLLDVESGRELATFDMSLPMGQSPIGWKLQFSPDGTRLLAENFDLLMIWDGSPLPELDSNSELSSPETPDAEIETTTGVTPSEAERIDGRSPSTVLEGHVNNINGVAFSPDGTKLATASSDETVRLWDSESGVEKLVLRGHDDAVNAIVFSPDGRQLASGSDDEFVIIWNAANGKRLQQLKGHDQSVNGVAFSPDGLRLASCGRDGTIRIWDTGNGQQLFSITGHSKSIVSIAFSPDGKQLMSGGGDGAVKIWDLQSQKELKNLNLHRYTVFCVAYSPDGKHGISSSDDKTVCMFDTVTGHELFRINTRTLAIQFSPDGRWLATCAAESSPQLWDSRNGVNVFNLNGPSNPYKCIAISNDGKKIAAAGSSKTADIWKLPKSPTEILNSKTYSDAMP